jgi:hypothetical protein
MSQLVKLMRATVTVAALALTAAGCTDAGAATAASRAAGPAVYSDQHAGYQAAGRWFRYVATTVTVPPRTLPYLNSGSAFIGLNGRYAAWINVDPGGGADSVGYAATNVGTGPFRLAPRVGDRLAISIYYDQRGHIFFTVTDLTRPATQTVVLYVGRLIYSAARLWVQTDRVLSVVPPAASTRLWQFTREPPDHLQRRPRHDHGPVDHQQDDHHHHRHRIRHCDREPVPAIQQRSELRRLAAP